MVSTFAATTCDGEQAAIDAEIRVRPVIEANCAGYGNGAASNVARLFTIIMLAFVASLKM